MPNERSRSAVARVRDGATDAPAADELQPSRPPGERAPAGRPVESEAAADRQTVPPSRKKPGGARRVLPVVGIVIASLGAAYYVWERQFEDTDDAQIDANMATISPRVSGNVQAVYVVENQVVKAGDPLVDLDPRDLEVAVVQAKATVAQAEAQLRAEDPSVSITETSSQAAVVGSSSDLASAQAAVSASKADIEQLSAQLAQAEANDRIAQLERERSARLVKEGAVSQADYDQRNNAGMATAAAVDAIKQSLAAARDRVTQAQARVSAANSHLGEVRSNAPREIDTRRASVEVRRATLEIAKSQLAQAELNLSYAKITAPVSGVVGRKSISIGDRVAPGQQLMSISEVSSVWVTANFRETQLKRIHAGQSAIVHVDAIDEDLRGTVASIGGATGAKYSVLPPENASGNYVKVVQRIPVRIYFDAGQPGLDRLRPGMSVEPRVTVTGAP